VRCLEPHHKTAHRGAAECTGGRWREELTEFAKRRRSLLIRLEEAYVSSRYLFRRYDREEAEELVGFAREVIDLVGRVQG
jgi:HEPN domain-containing protein